MSIFDELEQAADEILKGQKSEKLSPDEISEEADDTEDAPDVEDDDAEQNADGETDGEDDDDDDDDVEKSESDMFYGDDTAMASALAEIVAKSISDVNESLSDSKEFTEQTTSVLAKSILAQNMILTEQKANLEKTNKQLMRLTKSMAAKLDTVLEQLDSFGAQPAHGRKSVAAHNVVDRNFKGSLEGSGSQSDALSKSEVLNILTNEVMNGSGVVVPDDIIAVESGGTMRPEVRALLKTKSAR